MKRPRFKSTIKTSGSRVMLWLGVASMITIGGFALLTSRSASPMRELCVLQAGAPEIVGLQIIKAFSVVTKPFHRLEPHFSLMFKDEYEAKVTSVKRTGSGLTVGAKIIVLQEGNLALRNVGPIQVGETFETVFCVCPQSTIH